MWARVSKENSPSQSTLTTKEVSLGLDKVGWESLGSVTVKEGEGSGEGWDWDTPESGLGNNPSPSGLSSGNGLGEEGADEQVLELWVFSVSGGDV